MNEIEKILQQIKEMFLNLKFHEIKINGKTNYVLGNLYCIPQYINSLGFLIEYADSLEAAKKNWHDDGGSFPLSMGTNAILEGLGEELRIEMLKCNDSLTSSMVMLRSGNILAAGS